MSQEANLLLAGLAENWHEQQQVHLVDTPIIVQIHARIPRANGRGTNARPVSKRDPRKIKNIHSTIRVNISPKMDHKRNRVNGNIVPDDTLARSRGSDRGHAVNSSSHSSNTPGDGNVLAIAREQQNVRRCDYRAVGSEDQAEGLLGRAKIDGGQTGNNRDCWNTGITQTRTNREAIHAHIVIWSCRRNRNGRSVNVLVHAAINRVHSVASVSVINPDNVSSPRAHRYSEIIAHERLRIVRSVATPDKFWIEGNAGDLDVRRECQASVLRLGIEHVETRY